MKRPILIVAIGYIIGILWGLYFKFSIALLYIFLATIYVFIRLFFNQKRKFKLLSFRRYLRYLKLIFTKNVLFLILITSIISNLIVLNKENTRNNMQKYLNGIDKIKLEAVIVQDGTDKEYKDTYKIKTNINNKKVYFYLDVKKTIKQELEYGDKIYFEGKYKMPEIQRNYKGFDYNKYLKQKNILGTIEVEKIVLKDKKQLNEIFILTNNISAEIEEKMQKLLTGDIYGLAIGLSIGNTEFIDEKLEENFKNAGLLHILAVSGTHMTYLILGTSIVFKNIIGKKKTYILSIFTILLYILITGFSASICRAAIMGIVMLISKIIYRKNDVWTSIGISLIVLLIYNPYLILDLGLQLSYGGTIGIILYQKHISKFLEKKLVKEEKSEKVLSKILKLVIEIISVTISAQIVIIPIMIYTLNTVNTYFLISNLLAGLIIGPLTILCFIFVISIFVNSYLSTFLAQFVNLGIRILIFCANFGNLPYSNLYIPTPSIIIIIFILIFSFLIYLFLKNYFAKKKNASQIRLKNLVALFKYRAKKINQQIILFTVIISILFIYLSNFSFKDLRIHFIDVSQGDSTFIVTPNNNTILIDGGGSINSNFDVGKSTLIPYILDRGYNSIDLVIISHFDLDHVDGILTLLNTLDVKKVIISKQYEMTENYEEFLKIISNKKIQVQVVKAGDRISIEKDVYIDVLWPSEDFITDNAINNNAIVAKLIYGNFSMLFTGDIEELAEKEILKKYNKEILNSAVLKVAHHGSKSSSTQKFLEMVNPKIALIGVGKNNNFGHPNDEVLERLTSLGTKIYRTDLNGEITIIVKNEGKKFNIKFQIPSTQAD